MVSIVARLIRAWPLVVRRSLANWQLLSTVVVGVLMASAIMAGTVIYFNALRELSLTNSLDKLSVDQTNIVVKSDRGPTTREEATSVDRVTGRAINRWVAWMLNHRVTGVKTATFYMTEPGKESTAGDDNSRTYFGHLPTLNKHITIMPGGRMPGDAALEVPGVPLTIEGLVPKEAADIYGVSVGDKLAAVPFWNEQTPYAHVVISGLFERNNPDNAVWQLFDKVFQGATTGDFRTLPFLVTEPAYFDVIGQSFKQMNSTYGWLLSVDSNKLNAGNAVAAARSIAEMRNRLATDLNSYRQITELDKALENYDQRLFFSKVPMFVILVLITLVILYYVVILSSLLVEQHRPETILLRSRGASSSQVLSVSILEGTTIAVMAIAVAPLLASAVISLLGFTPAFSDLSGGTRLRASVSTGAYIMSALGGAFSFIALTFPAVQASRVGVMMHRQQSSRPEGQPLYQRFYLDVLLLIIGIVLFRQLSERGSVVAVSIFGEVAVDQVLLAVPAIILIASALVLLRLFPMLMRLSSRLMSPVLPAGLVIGMWQMARNPTHYARLSLLLILMAGLGMFAASFGGTLKRNFHERVLYSSGAELRLSGVNLSNQGDNIPLKDSYLGMPSVSEVAPVFRGIGGDLSRLFGNTYRMFAVDSQAIMDLAWFRDDFADKPLRPMVTSLANPTPPVGMTLPEGSVTIGATIKTDRPHPSTVLVARIKDSNDRYFNYFLGRLNSEGWNDREANLKRTPRTRWNRSPMQPTQPLDLVAVTIHDTDTRNGLRKGTLSIDTIFVRMPDGSARVMEPFDSVSDWNVLVAAPQSVSDALQPSRDILNEPHSATFAWTDGTAFTSRGIFHGPPIVPLPVVATKSFLRINEHELGETINVSIQGYRLRVKLADQVDYFPTLDTNNESYLIGDLDSISSYVNLQSTSGEFKPNEIWLSTQGSAEERSQLLDLIRNDEPFVTREVHDRLEAFADSQVDPLIDAGWNALLFVAFAVVFILSGIGFLVHAYVSFKTREVQFALMRTIGFTMSQLMTLVFVEQVLVIGTGLALGSWMGGRLGTTIMPYLGHNDQGIQVLPPFVIEINWDTLTLTYAAMALLFAVIIAGMLWFVRRISLQRILRIGEM
ncbi:ABC transporter permease [Dehalococcoidia bacterium]|nr:ABC transporter permease [Dehalococcoidia bacterium]